MKKATFTLFGLPSWLLSVGRSVFWVICIWCLSDMPMTYANDLNPGDTITIDYEAGDTTSSQHVLMNCADYAISDGVFFTDDETVHGNYGDGHPRQDTIEICPQDRWHYTQVVFTDFEIEEGDTLFVFNGTKAQVATGSGFGLGSGTGLGVSKAFGGWVDASCDPKINTSGCLTFVFKTDGDDSKGTGWEAWVSCSERAIELGNVSIPNRQLTDGEAYSIITIPAPEVKACGEVLPTTSDSTQVIVRNQFGTVFIDTILTNAGAISSVTDTFAIGIYSVEYILKSDPHPSKRKIVTFSVQAPALVCNDEVNITVGSSCLIQIRPDDILESTLDTIADTMYYNITIVLGSGKNEIIKTTKNIDNHGAVIYPEITYEDIKKAGMDVCGARAKVKIERIYYGLGSIETIINNGPQRAFCHTNIFFEDKAPPYIAIDAIADTLITCDTFGLAKLLNPRVIDNCDDEIKDIRIKVTMEEEDPCLARYGKPDTTTATVSFFATDACGNEGITSRKVTIIRPNMKEHVARVEGPHGRL